LYGKHVLPVLYPQKKEENLFNCPFTNLKHEKLRRIGRNFPSILNEVWGSKFFHFEFSKEKVRKLIKPMNSKVLNGMINELMKAFSPFHL
jgi:hypothetical protein